MDEIITERSASVLRIKLNRPAKKNAFTSGMYVTLADLFNDAAKDGQTRVVLWHGVGDSFCAGNDLEDFLKNPPGPGDSPQARLMNALVDFDKPIVAAVQGAAIGGGTTMLTLATSSTRARAQGSECPSLILLCFRNLDRASSASSRTRSSACRFARTTRRRPLPHFWKNARLILRIPENLQPTRRRRSPLRKGEGYD